MTAGAVAVSSPTGVVLVLGGARSGKSAVAETLAMQAPQPVTYLATMGMGDDPDLAARIAAHQARRPRAWRTVETGVDLIAALRAATGTVLVDSLGPWVAAHHGERPDVEGLSRALADRHGATVVVSEEVGLGVHPSTSSGRRFRDLVGELNQSVAALADHVLLVVAGRIVPLEPAAGS